GGEERRAEDDRADRRADEDAPRLRTGGERPRERERQEAAEAEHEQRLVEEVRAVVRHLERDAAVLAALLGESDDARGELLRAFAEGRRVVARRDERVERLDRRGLLGRARVRGRGLLGDVAGGRPLGLARRRRDQRDADEPGE